MTDQASSIVDTMPRKVISTPDPDEEVLTTRAAAEAQRMLKLCRSTGILPSGQHAGRKFSLRPLAAAISL